MTAALALGRQGIARTSPNPSVGTVIVADGADGPVIVGLARTADGGRPHAEPIAIAEAGERARGATMYVTLEPCSHHGKTPPCADAVLRAGIARVVVACEDPNPLVAGVGIARLREAGVRVDLGLCAEEARRDLAGHISRMTRGRPHVRLKLAVSADGAIGQRGAGQIAISGPASRTRAQILRAESDAIAVGVGTVLADDPMLTCRLPGMAGRSPVRVVFDSDARTPVTARLFADIATVPVVIVAGEGAPEARLSALSEAGADIVMAPRRNGRVDLDAALVALVGRGLTTILVEGGAKLADALAEADRIDEVFWISAPTRVGGDGILPFAGRGPAGLAERFEVIQVEAVGEDRWTQMWRRACSQAS
ncbi:bifunctional diaminohydroxyphosphoribosylaminopyrimidine deaminase/5-amino-6-(5-phosphoribosylamino)uracil reductase RibD [Acuticoccus sp. M5D2P5]|nr:bifunctional diaminohydroxyphosphoribosylaminopyrimidine deaminase/5-amino-6-(5-phosphoribosylamino)uracil reductase RibD [Acuticoccus kalidii]MCF3936351.1 bifunctional diaminohydroxyphosphoribosylaminopyrimidine deaminase/5-amino-6-(5-phosphoribosylamino)uracil reductase RibD [Acuticoccus kalidii]